MRYFVILAGGSGQRLWPLSTKKCPKHLIPFLDNKTLLEQTIERITVSNENKYRSSIEVEDDNFVDKASIRIENDKNNFKIWILTNHEQFENVSKHVNNLNKSKNCTLEVIAEPVARNTAPAILWICKKINILDPDATVIFLPADHFIPEKEIFSQTIDQAVTFAQNNSKIITLGIKPTMPATGYGYIQVKPEAQKATPETHKDIPRTHANTHAPQNIFPVIKFHEKPDITKANQYLNQTDMFWNAGIFVGQVSTFLNEFATHSKKLFADMHSFFNDKIDYASLENISIDYAIMEKSSNIYLIPATFEWHDVGNLTVFLSLKKRFSQNLFTKTTEDIINIDGYNNLTSTNKKLVVCIGLSDLCIVETDNIILVSKKNCTEHVKNALPKVKQLCETEL